MLHRADMRRRDKEGNLCLQGKYIIAHEGAEIPSCIADWIYTDFASFFRYWGWLNDSRIKQRLLCSSHRPAGRADDTITVLGILGYFSAGFTLGTKYVTKAADMVLAVNVEGTKYPREMAWCA